MGDVEIISNALHTIHPQDHYKKWIEYFRKLNPFNSYTYIMIETYVFNPESKKFIEVRAILTYILASLSNLGLSHSPHLRIKFIFRLNPQYQKIIESKYGKSLNGIGDQGSTTQSTSQTHRLTEVIDVSSDSSANNPSKLSQNSVKGSRLLRDSHGKRVFNPSGGSTNGDSYSNSNANHDGEDDEDSDYETVHRKKKRKKVEESTTVLEQVTFLEAVQGGDLDVVEEFLNEGEDINQQDEVCSIFLR